MTSVALRPAPRGVRSRRRPMRWRKRAQTRGMLISVAGAIGAPVVDGGGRRIGSIEDLFVRDAASGPVFRAVATVCVAAVGVLALAVAVLKVFGIG